MTYVEPTEDLPPIAGSTIVYLGPVAPHWDIRWGYGEQKIIDDFRTRVNARLLLLPKHDPQFRRNRERVNRDAERERITLEWDLGDEEPRPTPAAAAPAAAAPVVEAPVEEAVVEAPVADEVVADEAPVAEVVEDATAEEVPVDEAGAENASGATSE